MTFVREFSVVNGIVEDLLRQISCGLFGFGFGFLDQIGLLSCFRALGEIPKV